MICDYCKKELNIEEHHVALGESYKMHEECFDKLNCKDCSLFKYCEKAKNKKCGDFEYTKRGY